MEIITYATESRGRFDSLVNNTFGVPVTVLGWGQTWNGFTDKFKGVLKHIENKKPDDIVVFLDGFDSEINRDPKEVVDIFKKMKCNILFSKNFEAFGIFEKIHFGECKSKTIANTGMYMGYVETIRKILTDASEMTCKDDQVNINRLCRHFDDLKLDVDEVIFKNLPGENATAYFVSYPGTNSIERFTRGLSEYYQFVYFYISIILIALLFVFPLTAKVLLAFHIAWFVFMADKSCM